VILRLWLQGLGINSGVSDASLLAYAEQLDAPPTRQPVLQLAAGSVRRYAAELCVVGERQKPASSYAIELPGELDLPHGKVVVKTAAGSLRDGFLVQGEVTVRFRAGGEVLLRGGHHRALKQILQEAGIAPWDRADYPLLFDAVGLLSIPGIAWRDDCVADGALKETAQRFVATWRPE
jgi:tRNA(Ile)-lysidine synthase